MSNFKKLGLLITGLSLTTSFVSASCTNTKLYNKNVKVKGEGKWDIKLDKNSEFVKSKVFKAKIVGHSDGDTFTVEALEKVLSNSINVGDHIKLRLAGIDTPEKAVGSQKAVNPELHWAKKASAFAEKTLPIGKVVHVFFGTKDGFSRLTADVFFKKDGTEAANYWDADTSYCVEITKAGLTLPHASNAQKATEADSIEYYTYYPIALALKYAYDNKKGFFGSGFLGFFSGKHPKDFEKIYMLKPNTSWKLFWPYDEDSFTNPDYIWYYNAEEQRTYIPE